MTLPVAPAPRPTTEDADDASEVSTEDTAARRSDRPPSTRPIPDSAADAPTLAVASMSGAKTVELPATLLSEGQLDPASPAGPPLADDGPPPFRRPWPRRPALAVAATVTLAGILWMALRSADPPESIAPSPPSAPIQPTVATLTAPTENTTAPTATPLAIGATAALPTARSSAPRGPAATPPATKRTATPLRGPPPPVSKSNDALLNNPH
jgi:hypothetical protein